MKRLLKIELRKGMSDSLAAASLATAVELDKVPKSDSDVSWNATALASLAKADELAKVPKSDGSVVWNATAQTTIQTKAEAALTAYDPPTRAEATTDKDAIITEVNANETKIDAVKDETVLILADTAVIGSTGQGLTSLATQASVNTIDGIVDDILADTAVIGALGAGLTALATAAELAKVPKSDSTVTFNATALASINAEVDTALNTAVPNTPTANSLNDILSKLDGANTFDNTTDSLEAIRDKIDTLPTTGGGDATAAELAKVPKSDSTVTFNATALASINAEVDTAFNTAVPNTPTANSLNDILSKLDGANTFDNTTDSLEAIRDKIDTLPTSGGGSTLVIQEYTTGSGNWEVPTGVYVCDILLVAGGCGGGGCADAASQYGGGGGGGEVVAINNYKVVPTTSLAYSVGAGGAGGAAGDNNGSDGGNTTFANLFIAYFGNVGQKGSVHTGGTGGQTGVTGGTVGARGTSFGGASCMVRIGGGGGGQAGVIATGGDSVARGGTTGTGAGGGGSYGAGGNGVAYSNAGTSAAANSGGGGGGAASNSGGTKAGGAGGSGYIRITWRL